MDDFVCLFKTKKECEYTLNNIREFLRNHLHLELNTKTNYYPNKMGINFCGYRIFETHRLLRISSKKKIKKKINLWNKLYNNNKLDNHKVLLSWNAFKGHASHSNSYNYIKKIFNDINFKEKYKNIKLT